MPSKISFQNKKIDVKDFMIIAGAFVIALGSFLPGLDALEYFRHTEADRTLIGWEMLQRGDFLRPHLLGDLYLTKPPVFYTLLAGMFHLTGVLEEWAARLVTALAASLLVALQYLFVRLSGWDKKSSLFSTAILLTSGQLFSYAVTAEMDVTFSLFSTIALFLGFLSFSSQFSFLYLLAGYFFCLTAFLTKGPPAIVFFGSGVGFFALYQFFKLASGSRLKFVVRFFIKHFLCILLFAGGCYWWASCLAEQSSWNDLSYHFQNEILRRFLSDSSAPLRARGTYYYLGSMIGGMLPWSLLLAGFIPSFFRLGRDRSNLPENNANPCRINFDLIVFCICVIIPSLIVFSLSSGKASRYMFPINPFFAIILAQGGFAAYRTVVHRYLLLALVGLSFFAVAAIPAAAVYLYDTSGPFPLLISALPLLSAFSWLLFLIYRSPSLQKITIVFCLSLLLVRLPYSYVYSPLRNKQRSVKEMVNNIDALLPPGKTLYILEMTERWIPYYLIKKGRKVLRLTPAIAKSFRDHPDTKKKIYLLINLEQEGWRKQQISRHDPTVQKIKRFKSYKNSFVMLGIHASSAYHFKPKKIFPTSISKGAETQIRGKLAALSS